MASRLSCAVLALLFAAAVPASLAANQQAAAQYRANPIRKVVTMLQAMQAKVTEEGEKEKKLYDKFMCYCSKNTGSLKESIDSAEAKIPATSSNIETAEGQQVQLKEGLKAAQVDRTSAKSSMAEATAIREKEAKEFAATKAEYDANIAAVTKAVAAVSKGVAGAFLQSEAGRLLKNLDLNKQDLVDEDRQELVAFLEGAQSYAPQSGQIVGILKGLSDDMQKSLAEATAAEEEAVKDYESMTGAKTKEVGALSASIESKTKSIGELGVDIVQMKEDLSDSEATLLTDKKFAAELDKGCSTKTAEWEERTKTRAEELVALSDTIKVLNDDDALDLFKKTLPSASASFMQVRVTMSAVRARALEVVRSAQQQIGSRSDRAGLDLITLAIRGKKIGLEKVTKMIDGMIKVLKDEQVDDDHKKEYCGKAFDSADDKTKGLERTLSDEKAAVETATEGIATLKEEIASLVAGISALDKSVAEATEQRKEENTDYNELIASDSAAKEILGFAKNRLNKFYNPKLYKAPAKVELSREDKIVSNFGGAAAALVQVSAHAHARGQEAPPPPPETFDAYTKKSGESSGVIEMIDLLIKDLEKELTEAKVEEQNAQAEYETMMGDSKAKRGADTKSVAEKGAAKANLETALEEHKTALASAGKELMATLEYTQSLHSECDWLLKYFDVRKGARAEEVDSLTKAKAVLSGADYALLQTATSRGFLARPSA